MDCRGIESAQFSSKRSTNKFDRQNFETQDEFVSHSLNTYYGVFANEEDALAVLNGINQVLTTRNVGRHRFQR
jgi:hypothetical protein